MIEIVIRMTHDGKVTVTGQMLQNKVLCYGLLESAKEAIATFKPEAIEVPNGEMAKGLLRV